MTPGMGATLFIHCNDTERYVADASRKAQERKKKKMHCALHRLSNPSSPIKHTSTKQISLSNGLTKALEELCDNFFFARLSKHYNGTPATHASWRLWFLHWTRPLIREENLWTLPCESSLLPRKEKKNAIGGPRPRTAASESCAPGEKSIVETGVHFCFCLYWVFWVNSWSFLGFFFLIVFFFFSSFFSWRCGWSLAVANHM